MRVDQLYLSTIAKEDATLARQYGFGLEIAEYCTAYYMDEAFAPTDRAVQEKTDGIARRLLHAPFNELFPCALDPRARELAQSRFRQAIQLARRYAAEKVVFHGGYHPKMYYPIWYVEQSVLFWQDFLKEDPGVELVLENVLEEEPELLLDIVKGVNSPRLRLCLDVGHVNAYSSRPVVNWLEAFAPYLSHFHLHNNAGDWDTHSALPQGSIPMKQVLRLADRLCPKATFTLEIPEAASSVRWLWDNACIQK